MIQQNSLAEPLVHQPTDAPQRVAWGVILVSFAAFCVLSALGLVGIYSFAFQSFVPLVGQLQVSRGTASLIGADLIEQAVRSERTIELSSIVTTDPQSQAVLNIQDAGNDRALIASIILKNGASLNARQFVRPRFDWSSASYQITLDQIAGELAIVVPGERARPLEFVIVSAAGGRARLSQGGRYTVSASSEMMSVVNNGGDVVMITPGGRSYPVPTGQQGTMILDESDRFAYAPALINLLGASRFSTENVLDFNATPEEVRPLMWRCNSWQNSSPNGSYSLVMVDGQPALRLHRGEGAESHGETLCVQAFNAAQGLDVSMFRHVSIRARFRITDHSLNACGVDGSECPLMLRMEYYTAGGRQIRTWIHGFYVRNAPNLGYPLQCDSCGELHEVINGDRWYTYESGNLLTKLTPDNRPTAIVNLKFYASGHEYDVYVREVELLVDQAVLPITASVNPGNP
jgi:hypothetical protein